MENPALPPTPQGKWLTDIAIVVAATVSLFALALNLPLFGFFFSLFIPLPIFYGRVKLGRQPGLLTAVFSLLAMAAIIGEVSFDLFFYLELLLLGFLLGEFSEWRLSIEHTVTFTTTAVLLAGLAGLLLYSSSIGKGLGAMVSDSIGRNLEMTLTLYRNMGVAEENIQLLAGSLETIGYVMVRILPGLSASACLLITWACLILARPLFQARQLPYPDFGPLNRWQAPEALVWVAIACGALLLVPQKTIKVLGINGLIVLMTVYFFQGMAITTFFFQKKRFPFILRVFLYSLIVVQQFLLLLVIAMGFFDTWLNFRKLDASNSQ
ncbi:MAG: YybS family protein [Desulfobacterales bacterium]